MRKRIACLLLALVMVLPVMLASCSGETEITDIPAPVYTLYCITSEKTTPEAITLVEYEINRTLFYRIGSIVKLEFVTADEYHELIEAKAEEIKEYTSSTDESGKKQSLVNTAVLSESAIANKYTAMSGEAILQDLQEGIEIELECPRLDLFLVTDYASYLEMAENGDLTALDTVMSNEAKAIKSYVHSSFFNAAKVGNKTYGVPCNTIIGEYSYIVFNEEVLDGIMEIAPSIKQETLFDLEDLKNYLALVKENYPEVVPLANPVTPSKFSFVFEDGFPSYVNKGGYVRSTYEDDDINAYFTMLACYQSLGYFVNDEGKNDDNTPFAVKFVKGTEEDIKVYAEENHCRYNKYSNPIATSENSIDCIYCVSALCPSSWVTDVMEILTELYTDKDLQNLFLYGKEKYTYRLENDQVVHITGEEDGKFFYYEMNPVHTGNCFIAYTCLDNGDSKDKWAAAREQNKEAEESKTIGFTFEPDDYEFGVVPGEDGEDVPRIVSEPNYDEILWNIVEPYYQKLVSGTAVEFDYKTEYDAAEEIALANITENLEATYVKRLQTKFTKTIKDEVTAEKSEAYLKQATAQCKQDIVDKANANKNNIKKVKNWIRDLLIEENPELEDEDKEEELEALVEKKFEDGDYIWDNFRTDLIPSIEDALQSYFNDFIEEEVKIRTDKVLNSAEYKKAYNDMIASDEFQEDLAYSIEVYVADTVNTTLNNKVSGLIKEYCKEMIAECETALTEAIDKFVAEYEEASKIYYEERIAEQLKVTIPALALEENKDKLASRVKKQMSFLESFASSTNDTKKESAMKDLIAEDFPDLDEEGAKTKLSEYIKEFDEVYLPIYSDFFNAKALAFYNIGFTDKSKIVVFGNAPAEEEPTEDPTEEGGETEPKEDEPVADEDGKLYESYYAFVLAVKIQTPYYAQFGAPQ